MLDIINISFIIKVEMEETKMLSREQISQIVFKEARKAGYVVEERQSVSTSSIYFTLKSGKTSLLFRVADHATKSDVITFRVNYRSGSTDIFQKFVKNRIRDLGRRTLKAVLGL
jgi:hypothetical protein